MLEFNSNYLLMIVVGLTAAVILYFINSFILLRDTVKNKIKAAVIFLLSAILAVLSAYLLNYLTQPNARNLPFLQTVGLAFSYFFCMGFLFLFSSIFLVLVKLDAAKYINASVPAVVLLSAVCRIGCIIAGCCGGIVVSGVKIPTAEIECAVGVLLFFIFQFIVKTKRLPKYLLIYAPLRFILEFFRESVPSIIFFNILTPAQLYAIIIIIVLMVVKIITFNSKRRQNDKS